MLSTAAAGDGGGGCVLKNKRAASPSVTIRQIRIAMV